MNYVAHPSLPRSDSYARDAKLFTPIGKVGICLQFILQKVRILRARAFSPANCLVFRAFHDFFFKNVAEPTPQQVGMRQVKLERL